MDATSVPNSHLVSGPPRRCRSANNAKALCIFAIQDASLALRCARPVKSNPMHLSEFQTMEARARETLSSLVVTHTATPYL